MLSTYVPTVRERDASACITRLQAFAALAFVSSSPTLISPRCLLE